VLELERLAEARGFEAVVYEEDESAARARPVLDMVLSEARADGRLRSAGRDGEAAPARLREIRTHAELSNSTDGTF
jgi:hypothetical protein